MEYFSFTTLPVETLNSVKQHSMSQKFNTKRRTECPYTISLCISYYTGKSGEIASMLKKIQFLPITEPNKSVWIVQKILKPYIDYTTKGCDMDQQYKKITIRTYKEVSESTSGKWLTMKQADIAQPLLCNIFQVQAEALKFLLRTYVQTYKRNKFWESHVGTPHVNLEHNKREMSTSNVR